MESFARVSSPTELLLKSLYKEVDRSADGRDDSENQLRKGIGSHAIFLPWAKCAQQSWTNPNIHNDQKSWRSI